jgi:hypothetical protein
VQSRAASGPEAAAARYADSAARAVQRIQLAACWDESVMKMR